MTQRLLGNVTRGLLYILSAPAGTGKTTLMQMLASEFSCVVPSISYTTRLPRKGEIDGVHYHFIPTQEFLQKIDEGDFLEYVQLYGDYYGTSRRAVIEQQLKGNHVILVIDTQGAALLKGKLSAISIFVAPPSIEELERRLKDRKTDSPERIEKRLAWAKNEMGAMKNYDYIIVNDDLKIAYQTLRSILIAEEHRNR